MGIFLRFFVKQPRIFLQRLHRRMSVDPVVRDKKKPEGSGWSAVLSALVSVTFVLPFSVAVLLPLGILSTIKSYLWKSQGSPSLIFVPTAHGIPASVAASPKIPEISADDIKPTSERSFDIVLFVSLVGWLTSCLGMEPLASLESSLRSTWRLNILSWNGPSLEEESLHWYVREEAQVLILCSGEFEKLFGSDWSQIEELEYHRGRLF